MVRSYGPHNLDLLFMSNEAKNQEIKRLRKELDMKMQDLEEKIKNAESEKERERERLIALKEKIIAAGKKK